MDPTRQPYTLGLWTVKEGNERTFVAHWESFAQWTTRNQRGAGKAHLLQDTENPRRFISFGPWEDVSAIREWRERPEFKEFASKARELCEEFQPRSLVVVASAGR